MILQNIVEKRREQLYREKQTISFEQLREFAREIQRPTIDFAAALQKGPLAVIAEIKRASPSRGRISTDFRPVETALAYQKGGAAAISVLTEEHYFQGGSHVLKEVRKAVDLPILRKDFIIDPYQIYEARVIGADAILLIAALLDTETLSYYQKIAHSLRLSCLVEVHSEEELDSALQAGSQIIGINNRNLKTFEVNLAVTKRLSALVPKEAIVVAESGIQDHDDMQTVKQAGAHAVLIGETLMRSGDPKRELEGLRQGL